MLIVMIVEQTIPVMCVESFERCLRIMLLESVAFVEMLGVVLGLILAVATIASGEIPSWDRSLGDATGSEITQPHSERQGKFFPLFSVVRFANSECSSSNNFNGTCFTRKECSKYGGSGYGTCANKLGVCCVFRKSCGTTSNMNNTYFVNPGYPVTYGGGDRCTIEISRCNTNICQLRIDFLDFNLVQPNATGTCDADFLLVTGGSSKVPRICGDNSNEHVYVDFNGANPIVISMDTSTDITMDRRWNLRIQQIACDSPWQAPNGCLQYYKTVSGTVTSFNYGISTNPRGALSTFTTVTRQLRDLNYGVCVRMAQGYCTIEWSSADPHSFTISGDSGSIDPTTDIGDEIVGELCDHNYVIIPNPSVNGTRLNYDRFCGNFFTTKTTSSKPFVMYVVSNPNIANAPPDLENRGFVLKYRQLACAV